LRETTSMAWSPYCLKILTAYVVEIMWNMNFHWRRLKS
jgi:hypothetical protein